MDVLDLYPDPSAALHSFACYQSLDIKRMRKATCEPDLRTLEIRGRLSRMAKKKSGRRPAAVGYDGERLRELRDRAGLSAMDLAVRLGVHPSGISVIENGHHDITTAKLLQYLRAVGVGDANYVLRLTDKQPKL